MTQMLQRSDKISEDLLESDRPKERRCGLKANRQMLQALETILTGQILLERLSWEVIWDPK